MWTKCAGMSVVGWFAKGHAIRQNETYTHGSSSCRHYRSLVTSEAGDGAGGGADQCDPSGASPSRSCLRPGSLRSRGWSWGDGDLRGTRLEADAGGHWWWRLSLRQGQASNRSGDPQWLRNRLKNMQTLKNIQTQKNIQWSGKKYLHSMRKSLTTLECSTVQREKLREELKDQIREVFEPGQFIAVNNQ